MVTQRSRNTVPVKLQNLRKRIDLHTHTCTHKHAHMYARSSHEVIFNGVPLEMFKEAQIFAILHIHGQV